MVPRSTATAYDLAVSASPVCRGRDAVVLFAGGGGVEVGLLQAGIDPAVSVECDPGKPGLSEALADSNQKNFDGFGHRVIRQTVQELAAAGFPGVPRQPFLLHASPVCSNFSYAKHDKEEVEADISAAAAVAAAIGALKPRYFSLENVPSYRKARSYRIILDALYGAGYLPNAEILNAKNFGVPQDRERFIVRAAAGLLPQLCCQKTQGWYRAIADLIPALPASTLLPSQEKAIAEHLLHHPATPLLIERIGYRGVPKLRMPEQPCWTLKRAIFTDGKGNNRRRFIDIWLPDGRTFALTIRAAARLQGFPDWYELPESVAVAGSIIGYSVPPPMMLAIARSML